jgi:2-polyprenyl-3-methyl-5-hydroxy-6-metoxy-1,4-benzoquinol methylase
MLVLANARKVLDLGCGNGAFTSELAARGFEATGCDADQEGIAIARAAHPEVRYERISVYDDPAILGETYDAVVSTEVIEHLARPRALPRFAASVLKPRGWLILSTPYHGWLKNVLIAATGHWDDHHMYWDDVGHVKFFSRRSLTDVLEKEGWIVRKFAGAGRAPFLWKSMVVAAQKA